MATVIHERSIEMASTNKDKTGIKVGFIGLGRMGTSMAGRLIEAGHDVTVYGRAGMRFARSEHRDGARCVDTPGLESKSFSTISHGAAAGGNAGREP